MQRRDGSPTISAIRDAGAVPHRPFRSLLRRSHSTTVVAHHALPFVTATNGASVCVCAMIPVVLGTGTYILESSATIARTGRHIPTLPRIYKSNYAATAVQTYNDSGGATALLLLQQQYTAVVQRHPRITLWPL